MRNNKFEDEIIKKYVIKNKQERILWELSSAKKRDQVFWRFAGSEIFKNECLQFTEYMAPGELEEYLFKLTHVNKVYFIGEDYIGEMTLKEATLKMSKGEICIIYCGNGIGYYQGEEDGGNRPRCFLIEKKLK